MASGIIVRVGALLILIISSLFLLGRASDKELHPLGIGSSVRRPDSAEQEALSVSQALADARASVPVEQLQQELSTHSASESKNVPDQRGTFVGLLVDANLQPLPRHRVLIREASTEKEVLDRETHSYVTDEQGEFRMENVAAGRWNVLYPGPAKLSSNMVYTALTPSEIEIQPNQTESVSLILPGNRTISGKVTVDLDGAGIEFELAPLWALDKPVATGMIITFSDSKTSGQFQAAGLIPGDYRLTLFLDIARKVSVTEEISLLDSDVVLPDRALKLSDFGLAMTK